MCGLVRATIRTDGLRRQISVRLLRGISRGLRDELERLLCARGAHASRVVETLHPIDLELRSPRGDQRLTGCHLGPPIRRFAPLEEIDFRIRRAESGDRR